MGDESGNGQTDNSESGKSLNEVPESYQSISGVNLWNFMMQQQRHQQETMMNNFQAQMLEMKQDLQKQILESKNDISEDLFNRKRDNRSEDPLKGKRPKTNNPQNKEGESSSSRKRKHDKINTSPHKRSRGVAYQRQVVSDDDEFSSVMGGDQEDRFSIYASQNEYSDAEFQQSLSEDEPENSASEDKEDRDKDPKDKDPLSDLKHDFSENSKFGKKVNKDLAEIICNMWEEMPPKDLIKHRLKKQKIPENCKVMNVQKVNNEIFSAIVAPAQSEDVRFQKIQKQVAGAAVPVVYILDTIMNSESNKIEGKDLDNLKSKASEALGLLSIANQEIVRKRRDCLVPHLHKEYKPLRRNVPKNSKYLFGDDLKGRLKSIQAMSRAVNKTKQNSTRRSDDSRHYKPREDQDWYRNSKNFKGSSQRNPRGQMPQKRGRRGKN